MDLESSDAVCRGFLTDVLHKGFVLPELEVCSEDTKPCHARHGMCKGAQNCQLASKFMKVFNQALVDNSVRVGDLLRITDEQTGGSKVAFLGVCLKKPTLHVLVHSYIGEDGLCGFPFEAIRQMCFSTSLQMFCSLLEVSNAQAQDEFRVEVCKYSLSFNPESCQLEIRFVEVKKSFTLNASQKYVPRKPHFQLPFGLKMPKKKPLRPQKPKKPKARPKQKRKKQKWHHHQLKKQEQSQKLNMLF